MITSFEKAANLSPYGSAENAIAAVEARKAQEWAAHTLPSDESGRKVLAEAEVAELRASAAIPKCEETVARALGALAELDAELDVQHEAVRRAEVTKNTTFTEAMNGQADAQELMSARTAFEIAQAQLHAYENRTAAPRAAATAAVESAQKDLDAARDAVRDSKYALDCAAALHRMVQLVANLVDETPGLIALIEDAPPGINGVREVARLRERVARSLCWHGVLDEVVLQGYGRHLYRAPLALELAKREARASTTDEPAEDVWAYVAPNEHYSGKVGGERVLVSAEELAEQTKKSPMDGRRIGALMTVAEYEASLAKVESRKPSLLARTKSMTEKGWEAIRAATDLRAVSKEAAAEKERQDRNAAGLAGAALLLQQQAFDREYEKRARQVAAERANELEIEEG